MLMKSVNMFVGRGEHPQLYLLTYSMQWLQLNTRSPSNAGHTRMGWEDMQVLHLWQDECVNIQRDSG